MKLIVNKPNNGVTLFLILTLSFILIIISIAVIKLNRQQNLTSHFYTFGEIAQLLAEVGINYSLKSVKEAIHKITTTNQNEINKILLTPNPLKDTSLMPYLKDDWNTDLKEFTSQVDPSAAIKVEIWLRNFMPLEDDITKWKDPIAKIGWLCIESTGIYRDVKRTISIKRLVKVASILPPISSKFTLFLLNACTNNESKFNVIKNDYQGNIITGIRPLVCYNHNTEEAELEKRSIAEVLSEEKQENIWEKRGWIWLGGGKIRLNLSSGASQFGDIFHFYEVGNLNIFQPIQFKTSKDLLPIWFSQPITLYWDRVDIDPKRQVMYNIDHAFILDGFHYQSSHCFEDAMYFGNILSDYEKNKYSSYSSYLRIFGDARKGFHSRTKVFGEVYSALVKFGILQISSNEQDVQQMLSQNQPIYILPSIPKQNFNPHFEIKDVKNRRVGGPILTISMLFSDWEQYSKCMSQIIEIPYNLSYSSLQEIYLNTKDRYFPPRKVYFGIEDKKEIELRNGNFILFNGKVDIKNLINTILNRKFIELKTLSEFWNRYYDRENNKLNIDSIVYIQNSDKKDLIIPPISNLPPMVIEKGGMIILENGNLVLNGAIVKSAFEALTIVLLNGTNITFVSNRPNHLHIIAPNAEINSIAPINITGSLLALDISPLKNVFGGIIRYRESTDPTKPTYYNFYKIMIDSKDFSWYAGL